MVPPSKACLYGLIKGSLAQAQQQSYIGFSQSFPPKRDSRDRPWTGFHFNVQKKPVPKSICASFAKRPHLESRIETYAGGEKSASSADVQSPVSSTSSSLVLQVECCPIFRSMVKHYF